MTIQSLLVDDDVHRLLFGYYAIFVMIPTVQCVQVPVTNSSSSKTIAIFFNIINMLANYKNVNTTFLSQSSIFYTTKETISPSDSTTTNLPISS
mmetsp:Transcript_57858/g.62501  ORF Transcript_57858/g.62501 Transcript_57858/m.62501 type:complete len:94 (-) Transcript_57858:213-494(-)